MEKWGVPVCGPTTLDSLYDHILPDLFVPGPARRARGLFYAATVCSARSGSLRTIIAQTMRAILLASATAATERISLIGAQMGVFVLASIQSCLIVIALSRSGSRFCWASLWC